VGASRSSDQGIDSRTSLIAVDEIHNLNLATRAGAEVSDTLKYFSARYLEFSKRSML
jgi:hypothetical protein